MLRGSEIFGVKMIVTIHQPDFLPWLGFFDRWKKSDIYIVLDDVQFLRRGWHNRDRIKTPQGVKWLTIPVKKSGRYLQQIRDVEIDSGSEWAKGHLGIIKASYGKAPNYGRFYPFIEKIYIKRHARLMDLNMDFLRFISSVLEIKTPVVFSSALKTEKTGTERLLELVRVVGGDTYMTGLGSKDYLEEALFGKEGIKVLWQEFEHPVYRHMYGDFEKGLSTLDYLMMDGKPFFSGRNR